VTVEVPPVQAKDPANAKADRNTGSWPADDDASGWSETAVDG